MIWSLAAGRNPAYGLEPLPPAGTGIWFGTLTAGRNRHTVWIPRRQKPPLRGNRLCPKSRRRVNADARFHPGIV